ncbi:MAG TPA: CBS domain-containing protein [Gemmatimonadota bacterium]|jgi:CBS domain-containing protein
MADRWQGQSGENESAVADAGNGGERSPSGERQGGKHYGRARSRRERRTRSWSGERGGRREFGLEEQSARSDFAGEVGRPGGGEYGPRDYGREYGPRDYGHREYGPASHGEGGSGVGSQGQPGYGQGFGQRGARGFERGPLFGRSGGYGGGESGAGPTWTRETRGEDVGPRRGPGGRGAYGEGRSYGAGSPGFAESGRHEGSFAPGSRGGWGGWESGPGEPFGAGSRERAGWGGAEGGEREGWGGSGLSTGYGAERYGDRGRTATPRGRWQREALTAGEIMTRGIKAVTKQSTLGNVAQIMKDENCGIVPVVDESHKLLGVVTDRDIVVRALASDHGTTDVTVADVMSDDVEAVTPDEEVREVIEVMGQKQIRRVPVVDRDDRLVGIISMADIANRADFDEDLQDALERISSKRSFWNRLWS